MKPTFFKQHSGSGNRRSIGQAVASLVMAAAITVGGAGTTFLLASQPAGLTVEPAALRTEVKITLPKSSNDTKETTESAAESSAASEETAASQQDTASTAAPVAKAESSAASAPAENTFAAEAPAAAPEIPASSDPMAGDAAEIESENSFPHFLPETAELAAEDPLAAPVEEAVLPENEASAPAEGSASENGESELAQAQIKDVNGTILLTPEEIRDALDNGTLDEDSIDPNCLTGENGLFQWLWELFFGKEEEEKPAPQYSGWRTENGKTYYYDQTTHQPVTGIRCIDNKLYYFDASGAQQNATFGIDVSKYQANIDWNQVKTAGVEFVIIRLGYRGYGSGALVQDPKFEEHFTNARNAGLRVGVYCFSQAVNENEAREEAQACVYVLNGRKLDYPIYFDSEASGAGNGRADGLGVTDRTKCAIAFCEEVKALGYQPGVYASTTWFRKRLDLNQLTGYSIWNAHYDVASSPIPCNMWQGTCTARIPGYGGQIDVNVSYMG